MAWFSRVKIVNHRGVLVSVRIVLIVQRSVLAQCLFVGIMWWTGWKIVMGLMIVIVLGCAGLEE